MRHYQAETMTHLHEMICMELVRGTKSQLDVVTSVDVQLHDVVAEAETMAWEFDLKEHWLTKARWNTLVRQYLDPAEVAGWLELCANKIGAKGRGLALLRTKTVAPRRSKGSKEQRRFGSCMISFSYRALPRRQITMHSRTSYIGYLGALDLTVAYQLGRYVAEVVGVNVEDIGFMWVNEAAQYHGFKSVAHLLCHHNEEKREKFRKLLMTPDNKLTEKTQDLIARTPALRLTRTWVRRTMKRDDEGLDYGTDVYGPYRRIRRRFHTEIFGREYGEQFVGYHRWKKGGVQDLRGDTPMLVKTYPELPHVDATKLDLKAIDMPFQGKWGGKWFNLEVEAGTEELETCECCGLEIIE